MKWYIARHGKPEGADFGMRFLGITDVPLCAEGLKQAHELGRFLAGKEHGERVRIISSDLVRCLETAKAINEYLHAGSIEVEKAFREIDMGEWDGRCFDEIRKTFPDEFEARGRDLWNYKVPGGESFAEAGERFRKAAEALMSQAAPDDVIVIVSHAGVIRAGLSYLTDLAFEEWMKRKIPYCGMIVLDVADREITEILEV